MKGWQPAVRHGANAGTDEEDRMSSEYLLASVDADLDRVVVDPATGRLDHVPIVEDGLLRLRVCDLCHVCGAALLRTSSRCTCWFRTMIPG